ncbi:hypothetical protein [Chengkuizengella axinellae]|uniref:Uncharacterized protein n=1 Tax=Chengkuizengella axinellae TaxID=3064388 RepID=A0ABT9J5Z5_9BACL|nr:hypothetical protein [Chengkuizengella sp. 2205SS18-9]MDP5277045.1 hypothetical protein [Chengkuizengella sp. 2205SS18-9]
MSEVYKRLLKGEKFKKISDLNLKELDIKQPSELVGSNPVMKEAARKHASCFKHKKK